MYKHIAIIGKGKVGSSLTSAFRSVGVSATLVGRDKTEQKIASQQADLVLITTQDQYIEDVAKALSTVINNQTVAHCSGALGLSPLKSVERTGARIACAHPLNTFPTVFAGKTLLADPNHGSYCFLSGDDDVIHSLGNLFQSIGFIPRALKEDQKNAYHLACVMACNYLTTLADTSLEIAELAELDRDTFWQAIAPLVQTTLTNISLNGTAKSLSGPVARGDTSTISKHLNELEERAVFLLPIYKSLGVQTVRLATKQGSITDKQADQLNELLS